MQAIVHYCQARPGFSGTVAQVGENGVRRDRCSVMGVAVRFAIGLLIDY
jgi:hypothetical protein